MKLKVLLAPLLIVLDIVLAIWYVYPAVTDSVGGTGMIQKLAERKEKKTLIDQLAEKRSNVASLASYISSNRAYESVLFGYVPDSKAEDEIISGLNGIVLAGGSVIYGLSVEAKSSENDSSDQQLAVSDDGSLVDASLMPSEQTVAVAPKPKFLDANLTFAGDYENMKSILASLYRLKRFNGISSMTVTPMKDEGGTPSGMLQTQLVADFAYYPKSKNMKDSDIDRAVFSGSSFDVSAIDDLIKVRTGDVIKASVDQSGKANPFAAN